MLKTKGYFYIYVNKIMLKIKKNQEINNLHVNIGTEYSKQVSAVDIESRNLTSPCKEYSMFFLPVYKKDFNALQNQVRLKFSLLHFRTKKLGKMCANFISK
jgi:hypothetical protein